MTDTVLEAKSVVRKFTVSNGIFRGQQTLHAVNGVDIGIKRGDVLGLVGESGCGKSTLAKMFLGLLDPSEGEITLEGKSVKSLGRLALARKIQPIFQDPYSSLNPRKSISEIISLPLRVQGIVDSPTISRRVAEIMELVGLPARVRDNPPSQLSGGQRQRVAIARALINRPEIVICDEPTSALDVSVQSQILNLLQDLRKELNLTYVLISHNLAVIEHIATRVAVMYLGRIIEEASTSNIFSQSKHPYTQVLLQSVLTPDPSLDIPEMYLGSAYPNPLRPPPGCTFHPRCALAIERCKIERPKRIYSGQTFAECHIYDGVNKE